MKAGRRADVRRLLAVARHVEGDAPLTLRLVEDAVHRVEQRHALVHLDHLVLRHLKATKNAHDRRAVRYST